MDVVEMPCCLLLLLSEGQHITVAFELQILETGTVLNPRMSRRAKGFGHSELVKRFRSSVVVRRGKTFGVPQHLLNVVKTVMGETHIARMDEVDPFHEIY